MRRAGPMMPSAVLMRVTPTHLARLAIYAILAVVATRTLADPDLWGHVLFGRDIVASWSIPRVDPYSFTSDRMWVNHEWLAEVVMFGAYRVGGGPGLIALKVAIVLMTLTLVSWVIKSAGPKAIVHDIVLLVAAVGTVPRTIPVRPQLFSVLLFAVLLAVLTAVDRGRRRSLVLVPVVFAAWVNLHGGWIVGLGVLGLWTVINLATPDTSWRTRAALISTLCLAVAATTVNPYGVGLWRFLWQTVGFSRPFVDDWRPLWQAPTLIMPWLVTLALGAFALYRSGFPGSLASVLIVTILGCASASVSRLDAFFSLSVTMLLAPQLARVWPKSDTNQGQVPVPTMAAAITAVGVILVSVVMPGLWMTATNVKCLAIDGRFLPEPEAARFVRENGLRGRMFTWYDYGEYAVWYFAPAIQVSMDGRRETVYSEDVVAAHATAYFKGTGAAAYARALGADYAWLEKGLPAVQDLERNGWVPIFPGTRSVVLSKLDERAHHLPAPISGPRCFPGP